MFTMVRNTQPVAGTLWDIYDAINDSHHGAGCGDTLSDGVTRMWDVLTNHPGTAMYTIADFYRVFCQRYGAGDPVLAQKLQKIFCEHGIPAVALSCGVVAVNDPGPPQVAGLRVTPNPTVADARIAFSVPSNERHARTTLSIYSVSGRSVRRLVDGPSEPGVHEILWDGRDDDGRRINPGVYFLKLLTGAQRAEQRLLILR